MTKTARDKQKEVYRAQAGFNKLKGGPLKYSISPFLSNTDLARVATTNKETHNLLSKELNNRKILCSDNPETLPDKIKLIQNTEYQISDETMEKLLYSTLKHETPEAYKTIEALIDNRSEQLNRIIISLPEGWVGVPLDTNMISGIELIYTTLDTHVTEDNEDNLKVKIMMDKEKFKLSAPILLFTCNEICEDVNNSMSYVSSGIIPKVLIESQRIDGTEFNGFRLKMRDALEKVSSPYREQLNNPADLGVFNNTIDAYNAMMDRVNPSHNRINNYATLEQEPE